MSELAAKLARRRTLNGEDQQPTEAPIIVDSKQRSLTTPAPTTPKIVTNTKQQPDNQVTNLGTSPSSLDNEAGGLPKLPSKSTTPVATQSHQTQVSPNGQEAKWYPGKFIGRILKGDQSPIGSESPASSPQPVSEQTQPPEPPQTQPPEPPSESQAPSATPSASDKDAAELREIDQDIDALLAKVESSTLNTNASSRILQRKRNDSENSDNRASEESPSHFSSYSSYTSSPPASLSSSPMVTSMYLADGQAPVDANSNAEIDNSAAEIFAMNVMDANGSRELARQNSQLRNQVKALIREMRAKDATIASMEKEKKKLKEEVARLKRELQHKNSKEGIAKTKSNLHSRLSLLGFDTTALTPESVFGPIVDDDDNDTNFLVAPAPPPDLDPLFGYETQAMSIPSRPVSTSSGFGQGGGDLYGDTSTALSGGYRISEKGLVGSSLISRREYSNASANEEGERLSISNTYGLFSSTPMKRGGGVGQKGGDGLDSNLNDDNKELRDRTSSNSGLESNSSSRKVSNDGLFRESDSNNLSSRKNSVDEQSANDDITNYNDFIAKLATPECFDIADTIRKFLSSILGPNGDATPPPKNAKVDYIFYGADHLDKRCAEFFDKMQSNFSKHLSWRGESEEKIMSSRDCLERYVMNRIANVAFKSVQVPEADRIISERMRLLSFLTPENLDIKPELQNDMVWALARDELRKMNSFRTPGEKIACIVKCASVIFRSLNLARVKAESECRVGEGESAPGADDFLPVFIYVVMKSHVPRLQSNCEYIQAFHNPARLLSRSGYCFVNLQSAIEFILNLSSDSLSIDPREFEEKLAMAQRELNGGV